MTTTPDAAVKWLALLAPPDAPVCAVGILDDPAAPTSQTWTTAARLAPIAAGWQAESRSIYAALHGFDVNALPIKRKGTDTTAPWSELSQKRENFAGRKAANVVHIRCLPVDVDDPKADFLGKLASAVEAGFPRPTCLVETSPGKFQALWVLATTLPAGEWASWYKAATAALCERFNGDRAIVGNLAQVLRVPGYRNLKHKYPARPVCELREIDSSRRYSVEELSAALGVPDRPMAPPRVPTQTAAGSGEWTEADKEYRRKEWPAVLARLPPLEFNVSKAQDGMKRAVQLAADWGWTEEEVPAALGPWLASPVIHPAATPHKDQHDIPGFAQRLYRNVSPSRKNDWGVRLLEHRHAQAIDAWDWGEAPAMTMETAKAGHAVPPPTSSLTGVALKTLGELGWLEGIVPPRRQLLTFKDGNGKDATFMSLGETGMLAGAGGMGKSQAFMQLAVAVATGTPWLGTYAVAAPGPVLIILAEEDSDEYQRRIDECVRGAKLNDQSAWAMLRQNLYPLPMRGKNVEMVVTPDKTVMDTQFTTDLTALLRDAGVEWRLVILDPASRFMGADAEIDNAAATRWVQCLERLSNVPGRPMVLFGHHTNKSALSGGESNQGMARGSSALSDGPRWQANLEVVKLKKGNGEEKTLTHRTDLRVVKSNYTARGDALKLARVTGGYLVPASPDETEAEAAFASGDVKRLEETQARRQSALKAAKGALEKFTLETAQGEIDPKKKAKADRERDTLERKVRDAERALDETRTQIADLKKPAAGDGARGTAQRIRDTSE